MHDRLSMCDARSTLGKTYAPTLNASIACTCHCSGTSAGCGIAGGPGDGDTSTMIWQVGKIRCGKSHAANRSTGRAGERSWEWLRISLLLYPSRSVQLRKGGQYIPEITASTSVLAPLTRFKSAHMDHVPLMKEYYQGASTLGSSLITKFISSAAAVSGPRELPHRNGVFDAKPRPALDLCWGFDGPDWAIGGQNVIEEKPPAFGVGASCFVSYCLNLALKTASKT
ncbi:hypothetical protein BD779DRAFT_1784867 [Infundibulicybe gibba]|nr:hypothetical protein BD779DRAFT_1784867 [Infundibulicybe gibba]